MGMKLSDIGDESKKLMGTTTSPAKKRKPVGTGDLSQYKNWCAEMARLPGCFLPIRIYSEANMRDKWGTIQRTRKHRLYVAVAAGGFIRQFAGRAPLLANLTRYGPRVMDSDNIARAFKAVRDEVANILGVDDGDVAAIQFEYNQEKTRPRCFGIRIEIKEAT